MVCGRKVRAAATSYACSRCVSTATRMHCCCESSQLGQAFATKDIAVAFSEAWRKMAACSRSTSGHSIRIMFTHRRRNDESLDAGHPERQSARCDVGAFCACRLQDHDHFPEVQASER